MSLFLSQSEIEQLTDYKRAADQLRWLSKRGWVHEVSRLGHPVVLRSYAESKLGGEALHNKPEPDFSRMPKAA